MRELVHVAESWLRSVAAELGETPGGSFASPEHQPSVDDLLESVIARVEPRGRATPDLAVGQWVRFDESFRIGAPVQLEEERARIADILTDERHAPEDGSSGSVSSAGGNRVSSWNIVDPAEDRFLLLIADREPPLILCGAREHLRDSRYVKGESANDLDLYARPFFEYARRAFDGTGELSPSAPRLDGSVVRAIDNIDLLHRSASGFTAPVRISGLARVVGVADPDGTRRVIAAPLYGENLAPR